MAWPSSVGAWQNGQSCAPAGNAAPHCVQFELISRASVPVHRAVALSNHASVVDLASAVDARDRHRGTRGYEAVHPVATADGELLAGPEGAAVAALAVVVDRAAVRVARACPFRCGGHGNAARDPVGAFDALSAVCATRCRATRTRGALTAEALLTLAVGHAIEKQHRNDAVREPMLERDALGGGRAGKVLHLERESTRAVDIPGAIALRETRRADACEVDVAVSRPITSIRDPVPAWRRN